MMNHTQQMMTLQKNSANRVSCWVCLKELDLDEVKYHTAPPPPIYIFCGAECSVKWHSKNERYREQNKE